MRKEFYNHNFSSFIIENRDFFISYQKKFTAIFTKYLKQFSKSDIPNIEEKTTVFYKNLFLSPFCNKEKINTQKDLSLIFELSKFNININIILNKLFLLMTNAYIKKILSQTNSIYKLKKFIVLCEFYMKYMEFHIEYLEEEQSTPLPKEIIQIYDNHESINLFSIYKGIPIAHKTSILSIDEKEGKICVSANNYQIVAAKFHKEIFLLENDKEYSFRANICKYIIHKKIMYLNNIEKIQRNAPKRSFIRVQPKEKIKITLKNENRQYITYLYDISLRGLCVFSEKLDLNVSDIVTIEFVMHMEKPHFIQTQGEIKSITKLDENRYKYHIYFYLSTHEEFILSKYITKREKELIKELNAYISNEFIALK